MANVFSRAFSKAKAAGQQILAEQAQKRAEANAPTQLNMPVTSMSDTPVPTTPGIPEDAASLGNWSLRGVNPGAMITQQRGGMAHRLAANQELAAGIRNNLRAAKNAFVKNPNATGVGPVAGYDPNVAMSTQLDQMNPGSADFERAFLSGIGVRQSTMDNSLADIGRSQGRIRNQYTPISKMAGPVATATAGVNKALTAATPPPSMPRIGGSTEAQAIMGGKGGNKPGASFLNAYKRSLGG